MASLYELSAEYAAFLDAYMNAQNDEEAAEILQSLKDIHGEMTEKGENYIKVIKNVQSDVDGYEAEIKRLTKKVTAGKNFITGLKNTMLYAMQMTNTSKIKTSIGDWALQINPMSCDVTDPDKVPARFHIPQPDKIDKAAMIREHKATGEVFEGSEFKQEQGIRFR